MSLSQHTKCDLDGDTAKLDLSALDNVLQTAYMKAMNELRKECDVPSFADRSRYTESLLEMTAHRHRSMEMLLLHIGQLAELARTVDQSGGRKIEIVNFPLWLGKTE